MNRCNEYTAVKNLRNANTTIEVNDMEIILVRRKISLNKLNDGGTAMFADNNKNHHIDKVGVNIIIPFVKYLLRV